MPRNNYTLSKIREEHALGEKIVLEQAIFELAQLSQKDFEFSAQMSQPCQLQHFTDIFT